MKKHLNNKEERLDIHFKENFENFEATPNHNVWENIEAGMDIEGFDEIFNNKLTSIEQSPAPEVWDGVKAGIPLNLYVKKHLENLMKIAALLLCFMSVTLYFSVDKHSTKKSVAIPDTVNPIEEPTENLVVIDKVIETEIKEDFVYEIKKKKRKKRKKKATKEQDVDVDALWKLLMEDDEEFADVMDEDTKLEILSPPVRLPLIEETIAIDNRELTTVEEITSFENPEELLADADAIVMIDSLQIQADAIATTETIEPDLKIWVPLVVVEKHEIEKLIHIYDQTAAAKKNNNLSNQ